MHPAHPSRACEQASSVCTCRMNYSLVECGKLCNKKAECFFPLVPITTTSQCSTSVFPDSPHVTFPQPPLDNGAKVAFSSSVGLTDTEYTLLLFACSLDEFFLENKIMKTRRPLNTEKICVTLFPCNPFHFIKAGPCFPPVEDPSQVESCPLQACVIPQMLLNFPRFTCVTEFVAVWQPWLSCNSSSKISF